MVEHSILGHFAKEQGNVRHPAAEVAGIPNALGEGPSEELEGPAGAFLFFSTW